MTKSQTRRRVLELGGSVAALGLAGCLGSAASGSDDGATGSDGDVGGATTDAGTLGTPAPEAIVSIASIPSPSLEPGIVHVEVGGTVTWVGGGQRNAVASYHPETHGDHRRIPEDAEPWSSDLIRDGSRFSVTFETEGVYDYADTVVLCGTHESFGNVGRVVVGEPDLDGEPAIERDADELPGLAADTVAEYDARCREALDG
ncbi:halocyanin [Halorubrum salipaludis]|uniref:Halocyanin n=1 Tax=Halorubrum salipaludis TaxID=2032630 RepID=A0A2A2FD50_9EURY|nr:halocyanin [Halorubrum salipaludis]PAU82888.1 halocyanin [Halorubrum salipaludis]